MYAHVRTAQVIDCGTLKQMRYDAHTGLASLRQARVSRASATPWGALNTCGLCIKRNTMHVLRARVRILFVFCIQLFVLFYLLDHLRLDK